MIEIYNQYLAFLEHQLPKNSPVLYCRIFPNLYLARPPSAPLSKISFSLAKFPLEV